MDPYPWIWLGPHDAPFNCMHMLCRRFLTDVKLSPALRPINPILQVLFEFSMRGKCERRARHIYAEHALVDLLVRGAS